MCKFLVFKREGFNYNSNHRNIIVMDSPKVSISATFIRDRIRENKSIKYMVEEKVEKYIVEKRLYTK
jgi:nicotinate-nucleotide adenylyltransferase